MLLQTPVTHGGGGAFFKSFSSLALTVWDRQCLEESEQKDHQPNELLNQ